MTAGSNLIRRIRTICLSGIAMMLAACGGSGADSSESSCVPIATPQTPAPTTPIGTAPDPGDDGTTSPPPIITPPIDASKFDALRFLEQASFGPTAGELDKVMSMGIAAYLDDQFAKPKTGYTGFYRLAYVQADECKVQTNAPTSAASLCARDHYTLFELQRQFFAKAMTGEDQLRQRVAFALSQIFVVSGTEVKHAAGMATYQNMLLDQAFGNFRELMEEVTLSPAMGVYLDMVNNAKSPAAGTKPNENYAREFMQLFTIGTVQLNLDGTTKTNVDGEPLPAYSQGDVEAAARAFTGWTYSTWPGATSRWVNPPKMVGAMVAIESQHDTAEKTLLGVTLPAGQSARTDLEQTLDAVFAHPNVGPFVATRLIQHLVTSNPSRAYVARVASVFNDNGHGVRGDLKNVVRAILLDDEARGATKTDSSYGKLKDPALFMTGLLRGLGGKSDGVYLRAQAAGMGQDIFTAPSVFNYYSPLQRVGSGTLLGPEFGIFDGTTSLARIDFVYQIVYTNGAAPDATVANSIGTTVNFAANEALLADEIQPRMMSGKLSSASANALDAAIATIPADDVEGRARAAAYLLGVSAQYQVQR